MITVALATPLVVAALMLVVRERVPGRPAAVVGVLACAVSCVLLALTWARTPPPSDGRWHGLVDAAWIAQLGARWHLGLDGYSWPFAMLTAALGLLCCVWLVARDTSSTLVALVLLVTGSALGVFASLDLLLFFVFFELALIPMWFVIAWWGDPHDRAGRHRAATRFLLFTVTGSAVMLVGFVLVATQARSLQVPTIAAAHLHGHLAVLGAALMATGLAVKTPLVPLHTWLPDAHSKAPTVGSVLLAGVFLKLGTYGLLRLCAQMLPAGTEKVAPYLAVAGVVGIVWSGLACLVQDDLKRLVACSSIGHMGFVVLAIATLSHVGLAAAMVGSVAHGVITGLLFLVAGSLKDRYGTTSLAAIGRGLYARTPWLAVSFAFGAVASLGLPGLAGFWGELLALRATYEPSALDRPLAWTLLGIAAVALVLTTAYLARAVRLLCQGVPVPRDEDRDLGQRERLVIGLLAAATLVLGLAPGLLVGVVA